MSFPSLLLDAMTSSGVSLQSAYKTPANFNDRPAKDPSFSLENSRRRFQVAALVNNILGECVRHRFPMGH
jgi:hypothetical protein